jgi:hypothetical protein
VTCAALPGSKHEAELEKVDVAHSYVRIDAPSKNQEGIVKELPFKEFPKKGQIILLKDIS